MVPGGTGVGTVGNTFFETLAPDEVPALGESDGSAAVGGVKGFFTDEAVGVVGGGEGCDGEEVDFLEGGFLEDG